jgi:hypothetical protein
MFHKHHFVTPDSLGLDSDGSVLVCAKSNCTAWKIATKKVFNLRREKQFAYALGVFVQALIIAVPFITGAWIVYLCLPIWAYLDYSVIKDWLINQKVTGGNP